MWSDKSINYLILDLHNGLATNMRHAIIWSNAELLLFGPLGANLSEISIQFKHFH